MVYAGKVTDRSAFTEDVRAEIDLINEEKSPTNRVYSDEVSTASKDMISYLKHRWEV